MQVVNVSERQCERAQREHTPRFGTSVCVHISNFPTMREVALWALPETFKFKRRCFFFQKNPA